MGHISKTNVKWIGLDNNGDPVTRDIEERLEYLKNEIMTEVNTLASSLSSLTNTVSDQSSKISTMRDTLDGKASADSVTALETKVTENTDKITTLQTDLSSLTTDLETTNSNIDSLSTTVSELPTKEYVDGVIYATIDNTTYTESSIVATLEPYVYYRFTNTAITSISLTLGEVKEGKVGEFMCEFTITSGNTAPTITLPDGIKYANGVDESSFLDGYKYFISIIDTMAIVTYTEV